MKKVVSIIALLTIATPAFAATKAARPSHLTRNSNGSYDVTYSYQDKAKSGWYGSVRAELNFLSWKNEYSTTGSPADLGSDHDDYSFKPVFGANIAFGKHINYFWRGEIEAGYITKFTDKDSGAEFSLSLPYIMANGYYDFNNGLYLGAGLGVALPTTALDATFFTDSGNREHIGVSPMLGLMAGYSHKLDDNLVLDLRYRLAGAYGSQQERKYIDSSSVKQTFKNEIGLILDNSISIGIRYEF
ncbi:MAG: porin family protein [Alphaproteobacteria bacterium]|nr:porin family protein [Alphaproteobacteria bacterium]